MGCARDVGEGCGLQAGSQGEHFTEGMAAQDVTPMSAGLLSLWETALFTIPPPSQVNVEGGFCVASRDFLRPGKGV